MDLNKIFSWLKFISKVLTIIPVAYKGIEKLVEELKQDVQSVL